MRQEIMTAKSVDWQVRDVMVGVLHTARQLQLNQDEGFYHMPARLLTVKPEEIRWVALYQSYRNFGSAQAGVRFYGRVRECRLLPRGELPGLLPGRDPKELYYRFDVEEWRRLERLVRAGGIAPGVSMFTNRYLLENSRYFAELYIRTGEQLALYVRLRQASARTRRSGGSEMLPSPEGYTAMIAGYTIGVYTPDGRYEQYDLRAFYREPHSFLQRMQEFVRVDG